ncbi:MAG: carboxypeptidase regulatory-like domain-containing protein [Euryarchaeota archaeon]|nr:carboxypeptidase regulatory-like domain-containing protein [Euryarchaeota archaeon]
MRSTSWVLVLFVASMAGCADSSPMMSPDLPAAASASSPAPEPVVNETTGSLTGTVVDEEQRPIPRVVVAVAKSTKGATTDADGRFTINDLQAGEYALAFEAAGFTDAATRAVVVAGEVTEVTMVMRAVAIPDEPHHESLLKTAYIKVSWIWITSLGSVVGYGHQAYFCDPCRFPMPVGNDTRQVLVETDWTKAIGAPGVNDEVFLQYFVDWTDTSAGTATWTGYMVPRGRGEFQPVDLARLKGENQIRLIVNGGLRGINYEHKPDIWTTFAYGETLAAGFSALPPK